LHFGVNVATVSISRLVERQVAACGERNAILNQGETVTYRELNGRANAVARALIAAGFRRGGYAVVCMPRGIDLAVVLLAILKAGGSYTWLDPASGPDGYPSGISIRVGRHTAEDEFQTIDVNRLLGAGAQLTPNLPILSRGSDIACVLPDADGTPAVLVPHGTIASMIDRPLPQAGRWAGEAGAVDLWLGLISGATVTVDDQPAVAAA
jgi:hypothetical protein